MRICLNTCSIVTRYSEGIINAASNIRYIFRLKQLDKITVNNTRVSLQRIRTANLTLFTLNRNPFTSVTNAFPFYPKSDNIHKYATVM
jgi:hypothetical protein